MTTVRAELEQLRELAVATSFLAGWSAVKAVPLPVSAPSFRLSADAATRRDGPGVRQLRKNLRRVIGPTPSEAQLQTLVTAGMRSYARYWLETFRLPRMDKAAVVHEVNANTIGAQHLDDAVDAGRGFVIALPHMANWDIAGLWVIQRYGRPFTTVAERIKPAALFDRFVDYRESLGMEVLALTGGERAPTSVLIERLKAGGGVCLVADRDLSRNGIEVDFFGERARMPGGPAMLAALTGAALIPVGLWFTDNGWGQWLGEPIDVSGTKLADRVRAGTQALADRFAGSISRHPTDWHMLQKLWLADLSADRSAAA